MLAKLKAPHDNLNTEPCGGGICMSQINLNSKCHHKQMLRYHCLFQMIHLDKNYSHLYNRTFPKKTRKFITLAQINNNTETFLGSIFLKFKTEQSQIWTETNFNLQTIQFKIVAKFLNVNQSDNSAEYQLFWHIFELKIKGQ